MMRAAGLARLFSPADDRQVEFGDETVRERHAGQTGQSQSAFRFAHFDACAFSARGRAGGGPSQQIQPSDVESSRMSMANVEPEPMMSGRANNACAANGTNCNAFTFGHMIGPPAENA